MYQRQLVTSSGLVRMVTSSRTIWKERYGSKNQRESDNCNYSWIHWYRAAIAIHKSCLWFFIVHDLQENMKYCFIRYAKQRLFSLPSSIFHTTAAFSFHLFLARKFYLSFFSPVFHLDFASNQLPIQR